MLTLSLAPRCLWLALLPMIAAAQDHARLGQEALAQGLWEVAGHHFRQSLLDKDLDPAIKPDIAIRHAESLLRSGSPEAALVALEDPSVSNHPEASFWKAQVFVRTGRYTEALELLIQRLNDARSPHRAESVFTASNIQLILDKPQEALTTLELLHADGAPTPASTKAILRRIEILLDIGDAAKARALFPDDSSCPPALAMLARLLEGRLLLAENEPEEAALRFQGLISASPESRNRLFHLAALGFADCLTRQNKTQEALSFLLEFIQNNPESPQLGPLFERLLPLLPQSPAPNDPAMQTLLDWSGTAPIPATGLISSWEAGAEGAMPTDTGPIPHQELSIQALHALALTWMGSPQPQGARLARFHANRLLTEAPSHPLYADLALATAKGKLRKGDIREAMEELGTLRFSPANQAIAGESEFLTACTLYDQGSTAEAIQAFHEAADRLHRANADAARFNAYLLEFIRMEMEPDAAPLTNRPVDPHLATDLALERALSTREPAQRRQLLESFLATHPGHPRTGKVRLAAAEAALATTPPDYSFANAQIDTIGTLPEDQQPPASRITLVEMRILDRKADHAAVIRKAAEFMEAESNSPDAPEVMFLLGKNLYQSGRYNDARLALERLALSDSDHDRAQACWLLAARAAALVATQQSRQEAVALFDKAMTAEGPLSPVARLEKARLLVDMNRPDDAARLLSDWFTHLDNAHPIHLPAGFLLAEAIRAQGNPKALENALAIYDQLLETAKNEPSSYHRLQYLRGLTFEQMGTPEAPAQKRIRDAFVAYYSVLETETAPTEWYYFELCGFKALGMLLESGRWPAAIACARRIASFKGPRAKEAEEIASQLQLKHQVWED